MKTGTYIALILVMLVFCASVPARAGSKLLTDAQMAKITAGQIPEEPSPGGGVIAGNDSVVTVKTIGRIELSESVQEKAMAAHLVNATESSIANGTNVWISTSSPAEGTPIPATNTTNTTTVDQQNFVVQSQSRTASVGTWAQFKANVDKTTKDNATFNSTTSVNPGNTTVKVGLGAVVDYSSKKGRGAAGVGEPMLTLDTGNVSIEPEIAVTAGGSTSALFGLIEGGAGASTTAKIPINIDLPKLTLDIKGSACVADDGASCSATRSDTVTKERTETITSAPTSIIENARAEIMVGDNTTVETTSVNEIRLSGNVQREVRAANIVNAASSVVGNGLNVAVNRCCNASTTLTNTVTQRNIFSHTR